MIASEELSVLFPFGVSLLVGSLVGMQREYSSDDPDMEQTAGVRTFALMGMAGCTTAMTCDILDSPMPLVILMLVVGVFFAIGYTIDYMKQSSGLTTEISGMITVLSGALAFWDHITLAVSIGIVTTILLSIKPEAHDLARKITKQDIYATLKFGVITAIILPVLPNRTFGPAPFDVLNPFVIWLMVVLISGISFIGYVLVKVLGTGKGIGLTGFFGGFASSTAVTLSLAQHGKENDDLAKPLALAIVLSWTVMFLRVIIELAVLNRELAAMLLLPVAVPLLAGTVFCGFLMRGNARGKNARVNFSNPFELVPAIIFALVFTLIMLASNAAFVYLKDAGIYILSVVSGFADIDAISLSMAQLSRTEDGIDLRTAARAVLLAAAANTLLKGIIVAATAGGKLRREIVPGVVIIVASTLLSILLV